MKLGIGEDLLAGIDMFSMVSVIRAGVVLADRYSCMAVGAA